MELVKTGNDSQRLSEECKHTEVGSIPNDWEVVSFRDVASKTIKNSITGGPFGSNLKTDDYTLNGVQIIQLQNIGDGKFIDDSSVYTSIKKANELINCNIYPGEIILSKMGDPVARACIIPSKSRRFLMASDGIRLVVDEKEFNKKFVLYFINSKYFRNKAIDASTGSTRQRIGLSALKKLPFLKIPLSEQKAIATALSDTDDLINSLDRLIEKKKAIKQGTMQHLLTPPHRGGKRLPGFEGEWEVVKVSQFIDVYRGGSPRPIYEYITKNPNGVNWIKIGDTSPTGKFIVSSKEKIIPDGEKFSRKVNIGDFLLSNSMSFGRPYILKIDGCIHDGWLVLQNYQNSFDTEFLYYSLASKYVYNQYLKKASGSSVLNLNKEIVESIFINRPIDMGEQKAIAHILSDIDAEIEALETKKTKCEKIKKGMMQELLTGKTRLV